MSALTTYKPEHLGPAMSALTDTQQRFVVALVEQGGKNAARAYQRATDCSEDNAHKNAWRMNTPAVMAAIREEADRRIRGGAVLGASVLIEIAEDVLHKDRYKAAERLLASAGLIVATEHKIIVEDKRSTDEIMRSMKRIAKEGGLDLKEVLSDALDVEFEEVVEPDFAGLEDI